MTFDELRDVSGRVDDQRRAIGADPAEARRDAARCLEGGAHPGLVCHARREELFACMQVRGGRRTVTHACAWYSHVHFGYTHYGTQEVATAPLLLTAY